MLLDADGARRRRADRLDGQRPLAGRALRPGAAAVLLLQAALRAGHEPADRPDPRGDRDEPRDEPRHRAQPVRRDARARAQARARPADPAQPRARDAAPRRPRACSPRARSTSPGRSRRAPPGCARRSSGSAAKRREAIDERVNIIVLSDRLVGPRRVPIPSLLAVAAVHHHLVREGTRLRAGIILESGEPREVHHFATLIGYGASRDQPVPDARDARRPRAQPAGDHARRRRAATRSLVGAVEAAAERRQSARQRRC